MVDKQKISFLFMNILQVMLQFTLWCTYRVITLEWLEGIDARDWCGITNPLQHLPIGHNPNVGHLIDGVQEFDETLLVVGLREPSGVIEQTEWCSEKYATYLVLCELEI